MTKDAYVGTWDGETPKSVSVTCGWCHIAVEMDRFGSSTEISRSEYMPGHPQSVLVAAPYVCPREACHRPSLVFVTFYFEHGNAWAHKTHGQLPRGTAQPMDGLPDEIESLRVEAWSDFYGGAHRSAVVMARAAVQLGVRKLGGEGRSLFDEVDDLYAKTLITADLKDWEHDVRVAAREAAHPEELTTVTGAEANESPVFMDAFLEYSIALPSRRSELRAAKEDAAAST